LAPDIIILLNNLFKSIFACEMLRIRLQSDLNYNFLFKCVICCFTELKYIFSTKRHSLNSDWLIKMDILLLLSDSQFGTLFLLYQRMFGKGQTPLFVHLKGCGSLFMRIKNTVRAVLFMSRRRAEWWIIRIDPRTNMNYDKIYIYTHI
jgi:hypothetical protein